MRPAPLCGTLKNHTLSGHRRRNSFRIILLRKDMGCGGMLATNHSPLATVPVTPLFPALTGTAAVSPLESALTKKRRGGIHSCSPGSPEPGAFLPSKSPRSGERGLQKRSGNSKLFSPRPITHAKSITYSGKYFDKSCLHPFTNQGACGTLGVLCCSVVALDQKHLGCGARSAAFFVSGRSTHPNGENGSRIKLH